MIKNDRQYRITKAAVRDFAASLSRLPKAEVPEGIDPALADVERAALQSQFDDLTAQLKEYEALKEGKVTSFESVSLSDLPILLVKSRIACGMTHRELADKMNVKEQQIQRWEMNDYEAASLDTLKSVADALQIGLQQELFIPNPNVSPRQFLSYLERLGIASDLLKRLLPPQVASQFQDGLAGVKEIVDTAIGLRRIFGVTVRDLLEMRAPDLAVAGGTRFKLPARSKRPVVDAYTVYAHYLSALLVDAINGSTAITSIPSFHEFHRMLTKTNRPMGFEDVVLHLWAIGIVVLPLRGSGGFHGAVWKIKGRFVIALKQSTELESRWLYDVLHETAHIKNNDVSDDIALIEDDEIGPQNTGITEEAANDWAEDAIFDGRSEEVEQACTNACQGHLQKLKSVLPKIAKEFNVNAGALANHMAYRLAQEGENWWGAANNLQPDGRSPFSVAREALLQRVCLERLSKFDRELLERALAEE